MRSTNWKQFQVFPLYLHFIKDEFNKTKQFQNYENSSIMSIVLSFICLGSLYLFIWLLSLKSLNDHSAKLFSLFMTIKISTSVTQKATAHFTILQININISYTCMLHLNSSFEHIYLATFLFKILILMLMILLNSNVAFVGYRGMVTVFVNFYSAISKV